MYEVEEMFKCVMLRGSWRMGGDLLIVQWEYWNCIQVCKTEGNRNNNDSKLKELQINRVIYEYRVMGRHV